MAMDLANATFRGYRRENGRVGVRNHVIVLPVDDLSNAACEAVANNIKGAMAIPHPYGRLQFGADLELHFRTLIGTGANPNVAAVVVIGIEEGWTQRVVDGIAKTGKPVTGYGIEMHGDHETIMRASKTAREYVQSASEAVREEAPLADLWVSTKCGESDTTSGCGSNPTVGNAFDKLYPLGATMAFGETTEITGGEHLVAERCRTPEIRERFMYMFNRYQEVVERHKTSDLSESQPTKGNIAGGLTTIEEKALGNIQKIGRDCLIDGVLDKAETPDAPGLWFMDSSSAAAEMVTLCAAAGFVVHFFPTGQGNIIGNPILPNIKICANPRTVRTMGEHVDVDVSGLLRREMTPDEAGDALLDMMIRTANGRLTAAEALGHREFVLTRLYESA
ncbi:MAG: UxaA family hydrolase [Rhodospirillaceae bacterium]|nr:UxaA family hydrolase [Rhodospirillaceae bacterium]MYF08015.1 UxaA family hydrolase [Rhodospirillaceae bacterium]MYH36071.1 UxaA family hydrolase [Rhodospirillaceae bacterium]MYK14826.1 UxaA family hydrolase [Rhodospirillaceae bacterium]